MNEVNVFKRMIQADEENEVFAYSIAVEDFSLVFEKIEEQVRSLVDRFFSPTHVLLGWKHVLAYEGHTKLHKNASLLQAATIEIETTCGFLPVIVSSKSDEIEVLDCSGQPMLTALRLAQQSARLVR